MYSNVVEIVYSPKWQVSSCSEICLFWYWEHVTGIMEGQIFTHLQNHTAMMSTHNAMIEVKWLHQISRPQGALLWIICGKFNTFSFWFTPLMSRKVCLIADNQKLINCWDVYRRNLSCVLPPINLHSTSQPGPFNPIFTRSKYMLLLSFSEG